MTCHYKLVDKKVYKIDTIEGINEAFEQDRRIARTVLPCGGVISTVFLVLDHNYFEEGDPILFESMYFPSNSDYIEEDCERYTTYDYAIEGHWKMVVKYGGTKPVTPEDCKIKLNEDLFKI